MNLSPFKRDIDELIDEFVEANSKTFADMKRVWLSRKFSYIYEASPTNNLAFFMQSLYALAIGHMVSTNSLSQRLGGLYCLYCLHETQPFKPKFRIYISLQELEKLRDLIVEARDKGIQVAAVVAKQMLENNMFIFGSVDSNEASAAEKVNQLTELQNARVRVAYEKLFANTHIDQFLHLDMGKEVDLDALKKISTEYADAKKRAIEGASEVVNVQDIRHISEEKELMGERVEKLKEDWDVRRQSFYQQTRLNSLTTVESQHQQQPPYLEDREDKQLLEQLDDEDDGFDELEQLVFTS